ncbi:YybS family protein [Pararhodospirillum oryzae]|uniref:DUF2232 domain-containing protein n=1 Tax=Pararhodospirillum oryzae TaxID=478448 RepID=A0A512H5F1_9PROT|nr:hypothetical protein [Pararhodospirillum oryzae]GEO80667.1 hypothetical protein ROR02_07980 [Pararhodospirillum oryzae]
MLRTLPHAAVAGLAGILMFASFLYVPVLGVLITQASILPLLGVGLRFGLPTVLVGAGVALGGAVIALPLAMAPVLTLLDLLPAVLVTSLALRPAPGGGDQGGPAAWYPPGRVLAWLSVASLGLLALFAVGMPPSEQGLQHQVATMVQAALDTVLAAAPADTRAQVVASMPVYLPGVFLATWVVRIALCAMVAQRLLSRRKMARRPTPVYGALDLPSWSVGLFVAAGVAGVVLGGDGGYLAANALLGLSVPLMAMGLVLVHNAARALPHPGIALGAFYATMVLGSTLALAAVVAAGLVEVMIKRGWFQGQASRG